MNDDFLERKFNEAYPPNEQEVPALRALVKQAFFFGALTAVGEPTDVVMKSLKAYSERPR